MRTATALAVRLLYASDISIVSVIGTKNSPLDQKVLRCLEVFLFACPLAMEVFALSIKKVGIPNLPDLHSQLDSGLRFIARTDVWQGEGH